jgi:carbon-monoxide dehydrogenase medium subunit
MTTFQGLFSTALEEGEFVTSVIFPIPQKAAYVKFNQPASRFALTGVFVAKFARRRPGGGDGGVERRRLPLGRGGGARCRRTFLGLDAIVKGLQVDSRQRMISDLHGSAAYRANLVKVLTGRAVTAAG